MELENKIVTFLTQTPDKKYTAREIAEWIFNTYPDECRAKRDRMQAPRNTHAALILQISGEITALRNRNLLNNNPNIKVIDDRPRLYYYTQYTDSEEVERTESADDSSGAEADDATIRESDLYPILTDFLWSELNIHSMRIDEKRSRNTRGAGGNKWLYPDVVGVKDLSAPWRPEIKNCVKEYADKRTKLWSFETKVLINRSNVRESFFQTVSNSSWANYGYLVAHRIDDSALKELRILSSLHGIGFINLDADNYADSQIRIPARERRDIDWDTANRLTEENTDFSEYIERIRRFYQTGDMRSNDWGLETEQD